MLKILNIKDPHLRVGFNSPIGRRLDEFEDDIFSKIEQIASICIRESVDLITIAGDVFDIKEPSRYHLANLSKLHEILTRLKESTNLKLILTIAGNHDLPHSSRAMRAKSVYGYFLKIGLITSVADTPKIIKLKGVEVKIGGIDFNPSLTSLSKEIRAYNAENDVRARYNVLMLHEHVIPNKDMADSTTKYLGGKYSYFKIFKLCSNVDCIIAGHYHKGYPTYKKGGKVIVNNWNLTRLARNYYVLNKEHIPNVVIVTFKRNGIETEDIDLKVRDYTSAIIKEEIDKEISDQMELTTFLEGVDNLKGGFDSGHEAVDTLSPKQKNLLDGLMLEAKDILQR